MTGITYKWFTITQENRFYDYRKYLVLKQNKSKD